MFVKINSVGLFGMNAYPVDVELDVHSSNSYNPQFNIVGMADVATREARERIKSAFRASSFVFPEMDVTINLAPADVRKSGTTSDLAMAVAALCAMRYLDTDSCEDSVFIGELSLGGELRGIHGVLPMTILSKKNGFRRIFVPKDNAVEASVVEGIEVYGIENLKELQEFLDGKRDMLPMPPYVNHSDAPVGNLDFSDVKGQSSARAALEVAAAGGHNTLLIGPPGSGKSMLVKRLPTIMPDMSFEESIETTNIYSIAGMIDKDSPLITSRPVRSPHHTISMAGLSGGGSTPRPGEISLAHNGLLFLDELPEFNRATLEVLRQPLEDKTVTISRAAGSVTYPCDIMFVAAMNPCPCGYLGHFDNRCKCSPKSIRNYVSKISGPLLDRFDIQVEVPAVPYSSLATKAKSESSVAIRERVLAAREIQNARFKGTGIRNNASITSDIIREVCEMSISAHQHMELAFHRLGLSARSYDKILRVARTVADLNRHEIIERDDLLKAVKFRTLEKSKFY